MSASALPLPPTTERVTLADAAQDVCDSARHETECYVTVNRIDGLEACIPEQRAIEAATRDLLAAVKAKRNLWEERGFLPTPPTSQRMYAAADALETLIGVPS